MAIEYFKNKEEVKSSRSNLSFIKEIYWKDDIIKDNILYSDIDCKYPIESYDNLGVVDGAKLWWVKTINGKIVEHPELLREKEIAWQVMFLDNNVEKTMDEMSQMASIGIKSVRLTINMDKIYWDRLDWDSDDNKLWEHYDLLINHANRLFNKISFKIVTIWDDSKYYLLKNGQYGENNRNPFPLFDLFKDIAQDQWKVPMRVKHGVGHPSLAVKKSKDILKEFLRRVFTRYSYLGDRLYKYSVTNTPDHETGEAYSQAFVGDDINFGWIDNGIDDNGNPALYDYTDENINLFREYLRNEYKNNIYNLNILYNTNYKDFSEVEPPKTNVISARYNTLELLESLTNSQLFEDWHEHNFNLHFNWWNEIKELVKKIFPNVLFVYEVGSFRDRLSPFRYTQNIIKAQEVFDVLKSGIDISNWSKTVYESGADIGRTNWKKYIEQEVNKRDVTTQAYIHDTNDVKEAMKFKIIQGFNNGCDSIDLIDENRLDETISHGVPLNINDSSTWTNQFPKTKELAKEMIQWLNEGNGYNGVIVDRDIIQSLKKRVREWRNAENDIIYAGTSIESRSDIYLIDDLTK